MSFWRELPKPFFILAPMEAVTDVVFRHVVEKAGGPDLYFSEFTNATGWVHAGNKAIGGRLVRTDDETKLVAQLWGAVPGDMAQLAAHCRELGFIGIDINMGCPDSSAVKAGGGAGMIRTPENAAAVIASAKTAGLPVSVKTRLGYSRIDEWRGWLTHLLQQDIENLTIHLRTKKEMSKVPAHFELIPEIIKLRDEIAPNTLLTINGDIEDRAHGLQLVHQFPGINGIMIGRGVFHNPFCFLSGGANPSASLRNTSEASAPPPEAQLTPRADAGEPPATPLSEGDVPDRASQASQAGLRPPVERPLQKDGGGGGEVNEASERKEELLSLLHLQLDLYDEYSHLTGRPFDTLKRFFKIYVRDFAGAAELRDQLMHTKSTDEVRTVLASLKA